MATSPLPLLLNEYDRAAGEFFSTSVSAIAEASHPILRQMHRETVEVIPRSMSTSDSGSVVERDPIMSSASGEMSVDAVVAGEFSDLVAVIAEMAEQFASFMIPQFFEYISEICEATGNVVDGGGKPIWDSMVEMLETIDISFDADGHPSLPSVVMHPDMVDRLGEPPVGFEERIQAVIARRRDGWMARRRTRRLPRQRH